MDSKVVNREVNAIVWPLLKAAGFSKFNSRNAWRYGDGSACVLNFQSFNRYNADVLGVTSFSFSVNLGCYLDYLPPRWPPKVKDGRLIPSESECPFRGGLLRSYVQPLNKRSEIWSIDESGKDLPYCIGDVEHQIPSALNWYARLSDKEEVLRILLHDSAEPPTLWGFGNKPSPIRSYLAGYAALRLGKMALAREQFADAVQSRCFTNLFTTVEGAVNRAI